MCACVFTYIYKQCNCKSMIHDELHFLSHLAGWVTWLSMGICHYHWKFWETVRIFFGLFCYSNGYRIRMILHSYVAFLQCIGDQSSLQYALWESNDLSLLPSGSFSCIFLPSICFFPDSCPQYAPWESNFPSFPSSRSFSCIFLNLVLNTIRENQISQALLPQIVSAVLSWFLPSICLVRITFSKLSFLKELQLYYPDSWSQYSHMRIKFSKPSFLK